MRNETKSHGGRTGGISRVRPWMMAHQATLCAASYLIALTSVPMETAVAFKAAEGGCLIDFSP